MKIALISGSHRENSQSGRIAKLLAGKIQESGHETDILDLGTDPLPFWDEGMWQNPLPQPWADEWQSVSDRLQKCDGIITITPEWAGMVPAALKNFFLLCGNQELTHKAGLIVSVSSGINGAYPVAELRSSSYKNSKICYIPDHLIIRNVTKMFLDDKKDMSEEEKERENMLLERIDYTLPIFYAYTKALSEIRASGVTQTEKFAFGM